MDEIPFEVLLTLTIYRTGQVRMDGHYDRAKVSDVLRIVANALDAGALVLSEYDDWPPE